MYQKINKTIFNLCALENFLKSFGTLIKNPDLNMLITLINWKTSTNENKQNKFFAFV